MPVYKVLLSWYRYARKLATCFHGSLVVAEEKDRPDDSAIEEVQNYTHPNGGLGQARLLGSLGFS